MKLLYIPEGLKQQTMKRKKIEEKKDNKKDRLSRQIVRGDS